MQKVFDDFSEIEDEIRNQEPSTMYKYRDWTNDFHKAILKDNVIWFAHPKELNDPYDIRVPVRFDFSEVNHPLFFEKLKFHAETNFPHINPKSREFQVICENQIEIIKSDPKTFFENNYLEIRESDLYDCIGVFSLSKDSLDETMWAHYAINSTGFCIGFDTIELLQNFHMGFGPITYDDEPPLHSFIKSFRDNTKNEMYLKHTKWSHEKEFRVLTSAIKKNSDRSVKINKNSVKEIIVGSKMPTDYINEIITLLKSDYSSKVALFKADVNTSSYGLKKIAINY